MCSRTCRVIVAFLINRGDVFYELRKILQAVRSTYDHNFNDAAVGDLREYI